MPVDSDLFTDDRPRAGDKKRQPARAPAGLKFHEVFLNNGAAIPAGAGGAEDATKGDELGVLSTLAPLTAVAVTVSNPFVTGTDSLAYTEGTNGASVDVVVFEADADGNTVGDPVMALTNDAASPLLLTGMVASTSYVGFIRPVATTPAGIVGAWQRFTFTTLAA